MAETIDLKKLERKAYLSYHQDGLVDLYGGLAIILLVINIFTEFFAIYAGMIFFFVLFYASSKKAITVPRMGNVEFSSHRKSKIKVLFALLVIFQIGFVLVGILAWLIPPIASFIVANVILIVGLISAGLFGLVGYISEIRRFYGYGIVTLAAFAISYLLVLIIYLPAIVTGTVMLVYGGLLLYRFIRKYPKVQDGEVPDVATEYQ